MMTEKQMSQILDTALSLLADKERVTPIGGTASVTVEEVYEQVPCHVTRSDVRDALIREFELTVLEEKIGHVVAKTPVYHLGPRA